MSFFDTVIDGILSSPVGGSGKPMKIWRSMRDKRVRTHVVGCYLVQKKTGPELIAYVDSHIWCHEFQMNAPAVLAEWNYLCEREGVPMRAKTLRFQLSSRVYSASAASDAPVDIYEPANLPQLDAEELELIDRELASITDPRLREHAKRAMVSCHRWKKSNSA